MTSVQTRWLALAAGLVAFPCLNSSATAQIAVSANDNKQILVEGAAKTAENPAPDTVTFIDLSVSPPKVLGEIQAPNSVQGPPGNVAVAPDESFALVASAMKHDPADAKKLVPDDKIAVIDLKASPPAIVATVQAGAGASGLSINGAGTLALVANRAEGTVSVFTVANKTLTAAGKIQLGDAKSGPSHVAFTPDGKWALVTRDGDHRISVLKIDGSKVEDTKQFMVAGVRPYAISISANGTVAVLTNQGGGQGDTDMISVIDLKQNPPRISDTIAVEQIPEGATMSPDGAYVAVTMQNGSNKPKSHPSYHEHSVLKIFRIDGTKLTLVASGEFGAWGQGVAWSKDGKTLVAQSMAEKALDVFSFDGKELKKTSSIKVGGGPAGIRTAEK